MSSFLSSKPILIFTCLSSLFTIISSVILNILISLSSSPSSSSFSFAFWSLFLPQESFQFRCKFQFLHLLSSTWKCLKWWWWWLGSGFSRLNMLTVMNIARWSLPKILLFLCLSFYYSLGLNCIFVQWWLDDKEEQPYYVIWKKRWW